MLNRAKKADFISADVKPDNEKDTVQKSSTNKAGFRIRIRIRINLSCWIRIRIQIADPDPHPGGQK
jgi:hypothetical protein